MGPVRRVVKLQANKDYEKGCFFVCNLIIVYALTGLASSLFWPYPFWFSSLSCSMKQFFFIHLPYIWSSFSNNPKWPFVVANVIIVVLVGESNLLGSNSSPSAVDQYYDKHVQRTKKLRGYNSSYNTVQEKKEKVTVINEKVKEFKTDKNEEEEEEEEVGLPAQELNKRVEEFIARVNKQIWLEAKYHLPGMKFKH